MPDPRDKSLSKRRDSPVNADRAAALAVDPLGKAVTALLRAQNDFAFGCVSPIGHLNTIRAFLESRLAAFEEIWAASISPHHVFHCDAATLERLTGKTRADFTG